MGSVLDWEWLLRQDVFECYWLNGWNLFDNHWFEGWLIGWCVCEWLLEWNECLIEFWYEEIEVILMGREKFEKKLLNELIWFNCMVEWDDWVFVYV